eukprot:scpid53224/ scgid6579/ Neutral ceramidase B; Acylsphingosine deacylase 2B; N-acylsphingosine amidohydrolase 2B
MDGSRRSALADLVCLAALLALAVIGQVSADDPNYVIGRGMYDMTGPAGEINFMGYANPAQTGRGIHLRQFARAFVLMDPATSKRFAFVNIDGCMASQVVTLQVLDLLRVEFGSVYTEDNVCITGTHTHSTPGGFFQYVLFDITSVGSVNQTIQAYANGIVRAIKMAHTNMQPGYVLINSGDLLNASINRSPTAYLWNPAEERAQYEHDTDKLMTVLKLVDAKMTGIGMISWFAVHCTSMNNTNRLISSDNKGYAALLFEETMNPGHFPGQGDFVAAFAQGNEGDVSPNTKGARCIDTGLRCEQNRSTCDGKNEKCIAFGPGKDMMDSTRIIATLQYEKAKELYDGAKTVLTGPIDYRHSYVQISNQTVDFNGTMAHTCKPAMGYSFAAGTTDGPGAFNFKQGTVDGNPFWNAISHLLADPTPEQVACHHPKPILLDTGEMNVPFPWQPHVVDIQLLRLGQLLIAAVPGEFTTMSGRRLRNALKKLVVSMGWSEDTTVVIAGLSGTYSDYITTYEEYQDQRYEAGSTTYGPHTLAAYIQNYERLATDMIKGAPSATEAQPAINRHALDLYNYPLPVIWDSAPIGSCVGCVSEDAKATYTAGEVVQVQFHAGNPRNNLLTDQTFLTVEQQVSDDKWTVVLRDSDWHTEFHWDKDSIISTHSIATIIWRTLPSTEAGTYRIQHHGYYHPLAESPKPYSGTSRSFTITA